MIRNLGALAKIMEQATHSGQNQVLFDQAAMIHRSCVASVPEDADRTDVHRRYEALLALDAQLARDAVDLDRHGNSPPAPWPTP